MGGMKITKDGFLSVDSYLVEDVLGNNQLVAMKDIIESPYFAWYFQQDTTYGYNNQYDETQYGFRHCLFKDNEKMSAYSDMFLPLAHIVADVVDKKLSYVKSMHVNLTLNHNKQHNGKPHIDHIETLKIDKPNSRYTAIFYLENVDGDTVFYKDDEETVVYKQSPIQNGLVIFESNHFHSAMLPCLFGKRRVVNINIWV
jgi:hypothetical protein